MDPARVAFCPILFAKNGGQFDNLGRPFTPTSVERARGKCDVAHDCGVCPLLGEWVNARIAEGWTVGWECVECLKRDVPVGKTADPNVRIVPGFFQSSRNRWMPDEWEEVEPKVPLEGCTNCGWGSMLLQLVLRRER